MMMATVAVAMNNHSHSRHWQQGWQWQWWWRQQRWQWRHLRQWWTRVVIVGIGGGERRQKQQPWTSIDGNIDSKSSWDNTPLTFFYFGATIFFILGLRLSFLLQKGVSVNSPTSPRRVWDDLGWKAPPVIIPNLWGEGNKSRTWKAILLLRKFEWVMSSKSTVLDGYWPWQCSHKDYCHYHKLKHANTMRSLCLMSLVYLPKKNGGSL